MGKLFKITVLGILLSSIGSSASAFWFGGPGGFVDIPLPQQAVQQRSPGAPESTDTVFVLTADSFVDDQNKPLNLKNKSFAHGMGVVTKQVDTFQKILQANPELESTVFQIATFDGRLLATYGANGPIDPRSIPADSKRIVSLIADIKGDKMDEKTGKISFSAKSVYETLNTALEALKTKAVVTNLSLSTDGKNLPNPNDPIPGFRELMQKYQNTLFVASADGWPGNYADRLPNLVAVGSTSDRREDSLKNVVYAPGRVQVTNPKGLSESATGRSFAVPQAVIAAALAWQQNGNLNSADLRNIIVTPTMEATADAPGVLNPQASLELANSYNPSSPSFGTAPLDPFSPFGFIW